MQRPDAREVLTDLELDQMLAAGRLSGRQYDEVYGNVVRQLERGHRRRHVAALLAAAGVLGGIGLLTSRDWLSRPDDKLVAHEDDFSVKGLPGTGVSVIQDRALPASVDLGCAGRPRRVCQLGDTLIFSVSGARSPGYLGVYAVRIGTSASERIWYFAGPGGTAAPRVDAGPETHVLDVGIRLGPPHAPGQYVVFAWLSPTPAAEVPSDSGIRSLGVIEILADD